MERRRNNSPIIKQKSTPIRSSALLSHISFGLLKVIIFPKLQLLSLQFPCKFSLNDGPPDRQKEQNPLHSNQVVPMVIDPKLEYSILHKFITAALTKHILFFPAKLLSKYDIFSTTPNISCSVFKAIIPVRAATKAAVGCGVVTAISYKLATSYGDSVLHRPYPAEI